MTAPQNGETLECEWEAFKWSFGHAYINIILWNDSSRNMPRWKRVWCKQREWKLAKISAEKSLRRNTQNLEIDHFQGRLSQVQNAEMGGKRSLVHGDECFGKYHNSDEIISYKR